MSTYPAEDVDTREQEAALDDGLSTVLKERGVAYDTVGCICIDSQGNFNIQNNHKMTIAKTY